MEKKWLETLKKCEPLKEKDFRQLCKKVQEIFIEESNLQPVSAPVTICGDIHGQFYDLLQLFQIGGDLPETKYLFMGDYVDRGYHSVETISLLLCYKLIYPSSITLLRGNHESRFVSGQYGLSSEIERKYGNANPWKYLCETFDYMPIAAIIEGKIFCVHGGLSPTIACIDQIRMYDRFMELDCSSPLGDLLWSDPSERESSHWTKSFRGAGWNFGSTTVKEFIYINGLDLVCRSHQLVNEGYKYYFGEEYFVNVWSAPNYTYRLKNLASILKIDSNLERTFKIFKEDPESKKSIPPNKILPYFL